MCYKFELLVRANLQIANKNKSISHDSSGSQKMKSSPKRHNFRYRRLLIVLAIGMVVVPCILYSLGGESRAPVSPDAVDPAPKSTLDQTVPKEKAKAEVPPQHPQKKVKIPQQVVPPKVFSARAAYRSVECT